MSYTVVGFIVIIEFEDYWCHRIMSYYSSSSRNNMTSSKKNPDAKGAGSPRNSDSGGSPQSPDVELLEQHSQQLTIHEYNHKHSSSTQRVEDSYSVEPDPVKTNMNRPYQYRHDLPPRGDLDLYRRRDQIDEAEMFRRRKDLDKERSNNVSTSRRPQAWVRPPDYKSRFARPPPRELRQKLSTTNVKISEKEIIDATLLKYKGLFAEDNPAVLPLTSNEKETALQNLPISVVQHQEKNSLESMMETAEKVSIPTDKRKLSDVENDKPSKRCRLEEQDKQISITKDLGTISSYRDMQKVPEKEGVEKQGSLSSLRIAEKIAIQRHTLNNHNKPLEYDFYDDLIEEQLCKMKCKGSVEQISKQDQSLPQDSNLAVQEPTENAEKNNSKRKEPNNVTIISCKGKKARNQSLLASTKKTNMEESNLTKLKETQFSNNNQDMAEPLIQVHKSKDNVAKTSCQENKAKYSTSPKRTLPEESNTTESTHTKLPKKQDLAGQISVKSTHNKTEKKRTMSAESNKSAEERRKRHTKHRKSSKKGTVSHKEDIEEPKDCSKTRNDEKQKAKNKREAPKDDKKRQKRTKLPIQMEPLFAPDAIINKERPVNRRCKQKGLETSDNVLRKVFKKLKKCGYNEEESSKCHKEVTLAEPCQEFVIDEIYPEPTATKPCKERTATEPRKKVTLAEPCQEFVLDELFQEPTLDEPCKVSTATEQYQVPLLCKPCKLATLCKSCKDATVCKSCKKTTVAAESWEEVTEVESYQVAVGRWKRRYSPDSTPKPGDSSKPDQMEFELPDQSKTCELGFPFLSQADSVDEENIIEVTAIKEEEEKPDEVQYLGFYVATTTAAAPPEVTSDAIMDADTEDECSRDTSNFQALIDEEDSNNAPCPSPLAIDEDTEFPMVSPLSSIETIDLTTDDFHDTNFDSQSVNDVEDLVDSETAVFDIPTTDSSNDSVAEVKDEETQEKSSEDEEDELTTDPMASPADHTAEEDVSQVKFASISCDKACELVGNSSDGVTLSADVSSSASTQQEVPSVQYEGIPTDTKPECPTQTDVTAAFESSVKVDKESSRQESLCSDVDVPLSDIEPTISFMQDDSATCHEEPTSVNQNADVSDHLEITTKTEVQPESTSEETQFVPLVSSQQGVETKFEGEPNQETHCETTISEHQEVPTKLSLELNELIVQPNQETHCETTISEHQEVPVKMSLELNELIVQPNQETHCETTISEHQEVPTKMSLELNELIVQPNQETHCETTISEHHEVPTKMSLELNELIVQPNQETQFVPALSEHQETVTSNASIHPELSNSNQEDTDADPLAVNITEEETATNVSMNEQQAPDDLTTNQEQAALNLSISSTLNITEEETPSNPSPSEQPETSSAALNLSFNEQQASDPTEQQVLNLSLNEQKPLPTSLQRPARKPVQLSVLQVTEQQQQIPSAENSAQFLELKGWLCSYEHAHTFLVNAECEDLKTQWANMCVQSGAKICSILHHWTRFQDNFPCILSNFYKYAAVSARDKLVEKTYLDMLLLLKAVTVKILEESDPANARDIEMLQRILHMLEECRQEEEKRARTVNVVQLRNLIPARPAQNPFDAALQMFLQFAGMQEVQEAAVPASWTRSQPDNQAAASQAQMNIAQAPAPNAGVNPFLNLPSSTQEYYMSRMNAPAAQPAKPARRNSQSQSANPQPQKRGGRKKASEPPPMTPQQLMHVQQQRQYQQQHSSQLMNPAVNPPTAAYPPPNYMQQAMGNPQWNNTPAQPHPHPMYQHYTPAQNLVRLNTNPHILAMQQQMLATRPAYAGEPHASQRHSMQPNQAPSTSRSSTTLPPAYPAHVSNTHRQARAANFRQTTQNLSNSAETSRVQLNEHNSRIAREASSRRPEEIKASAVREAMSGRPGEQVAAHLQEVAQRQAAWQQYHHCEAVKNKLQMLEQERAGRRLEMRQKTAANIPVTQQEKEWDVRCTSHIESLCQEIMRYQQFAAHQHLNRTAMAAAAAQQQGQPTQHQGQLTQHQGQPTQHQGQPTQHQGQPTQHQGQPTQHQGQPTQHQGQPTQHQGQLMQHQGQPTQHQGQPTQHQGQPMQHQGQPTQAPETAASSSRQPVENPRREQSSATMSVAPVPDPSSQESQRVETVGRSPEEQYMETGPCQRCGKTAVDLCQECQVVWYCSPICQATDWIIGQHSEKCTLLKAAKNPTDASQSTSS